MNTPPETPGRPWIWLDWNLIALLARFALAGVFWLSGQTKIEGLQIDLVQGRFELGWPTLADSAVALFSDEYRLPLLPPETAATLAALGEQLLPLLLLLGLGTRLAASGLLAMTLVIQLLVYPGAWPTHGTWAAGLLALMRFGGGRYGLDFLLGRWLAPRAAAGGWPRWLRVVTA
jgi:putative oxidoreductase